MAIQARKRSTRGFTLVEVLIAIFIFSIIVTTVFASHRSVFVSAPIVESNIDLYEMSGTCLGRMAQDLRAIYIAQPPAYQKPEFDADPDPHRVVGAADEGGSTPRLRFASLAHLPLEQSSREGVAQIVYYETPVGEDTFRLRRADSLYPFPAFEADERDPVLCEMVKRLEITFLDQEGNEYEYWDSESDEFDYATPVAINFMIELVKDGSTSVFETRVSLPVVRENLE
ncbi:MAG: prepilin-type N-terminal cleavage/methylation domain-containing protein [Thermodesulfobacteriota bacterium]